MELVGKVIIFEDEEQAKVWYEVIEATRKHSAAESWRYRIDETLSRLGVIA